MNHSSIARSDHAALAARLHAWVGDQARKRKLVGLSYALVSRDGVVSAGGAGFADREAGRPAAPGTVYRIGSLTKTVTASVIMRLVEQGRVRLDAPITDYLPQFSIQSRFGATDPITVRSLLGHYAGIPNLLRRADANGDPVAFNELLPALSEAWLTHAPGRVTKYSSHGYNVLGQMVEAVTGERFADVARREVLAPAGMTSSDYDPDRDLTERMARGYKSGKPVRSLPSLKGEIPAGGLHTTVLDLAAFMQMILRDGDAAGGRVLARSSIDEMLSPALHSPLDIEPQLGLGWGISTPGSVRHLGKVAATAGSAFQFHAFALVHRELGLAAIVCCNTEEGRAAIEKMTAEILNLAWQVETGKPRPEPPASAREPVVPLEEWSTYAGRYQSLAGVLDIAVNNRAEARLIGRRLTLTDMGGGAFRPRYLLLGSVPISIPGVSNLRFSFATVGDQQVIVVNDRGSTQRLAERIERVPIPDAWRRRVGQYDLRDSRLSDLIFKKRPHMEIREDDGWLIIDTHPAVHPSIELSWVLQPVSDTLAVCAGYSNYLGGESVAAIDLDGREGLAFSGYTFERVTTR